MITTTIVDFSAGPHTRRLWESVSSIIADIEKLPFLEQLTDGTLDPLAFTNYILQDDIYLAGYRRALSTLAAKAKDRDYSRFWADSTVTTVDVEVGMHQGLLADDRLAAARAQLLNGTSAIQPSPTTLGYTSFVIAAATVEDYAIGVAGVLPCYWIYAHAGKVLVQKAGTLSADHPYKAWIDMYDSEEFDAATQKAVTILEKSIDSASERDRQRIDQVFTQASLYELHFWGTAHYLQGWELDIPPAH